MYQEVRNFLACGVCYNNIANLQLKSGRYQLAYENFEKSIKMGYKSEKKYNEQKQLNVKG